MKLWRISCVLAALYALFTTACSSTPSAPDSTKKSSSDLRDRVKKITLDNGMVFLLAPRESAPVVSIQLKVKVGNIEEEPGSSGLAHFFEHLAFKGTDKIGTKDYIKEEILLAEINGIGSRIAEMKKAGKPESEYADLLKKRRELETEQNKLLVKNEFLTIYQSAGGRDINASTSNDFTTYIVSLPSNRIELWAYLESERLQKRIFREFFTEVDVVAEERRMRIDNSPDGRLYEAYTDAAFLKSPYKVHPIGYAKDIQVYTPKAAREFYSRYYIPSRMVGVIAGNFDVPAVEAIIRKYFSQLEKKDDQPKTFPKEEFDGTYPRSVTIEDPVPARFYMGYHRPAHPHPDDIILDVVQDLMCSGRTSRLYKKLVLEERVVANVGCYASVPGARLDGLFTFNATPLAPHTNAQIQDKIRAEIARLAAEGPTDKELAIIKNRTDAENVYAMQTNSGLASTLAFYESLTGDWRYFYDRQDVIRDITSEDIKRVVKTYFVPTREVTANLEQKKSQSENENE